MSNTAESINTKVNGINTNRVIELATNMAQNQNYGRFRFRANNEWVDGTESRTTIQDFFAGGHERSERKDELVVNSDQPVFLGGNNTAPNAVEHYLNSLCSCLTTTIIAHASVQAYSIENLSVSSEGQMDARGFFGVSEDVARGFTKIDVNIKANGNVDKNAILKMASYSPVYEMVSKAMQVELAISIV